MGPKLTQAEGFVLGLGAKMFTIAGPVLVYGVSASVVYGIICWKQHCIQERALYRSFLHFGKMLVMVETCG